VAAESVRARHNLQLAAAASPCYDITGTDILTGPTCNYLSHMSYVDLPAVSCSTRTMTLNAVMTDFKTAAGSYVGMQSAASWDALRAGSGGKYTVFKNALDAVWNPTPAAGDLASALLTDTAAVAGSMNNFAALSAAVMNAGVAVTTQTAAAVTYADDVTALPLPDLSALVTTMDTLATLQASFGSPGSTVSFELDFFPTCRYQPAQCATCRQACMMPGAAHRWFTCQRMVIMVTASRFWAVCVLASKLPPALNAVIAANTGDYYHPRLSGCSHETPDSAATNSRQLSRLKFNLPAGILCKGDHANLSRMCAGAEWHIDRIISPLQLWCLQEWQPGI
jgi:hypothetical protein